MKVFRVRPLRSLIMGTMLLAGAAMMSGCYHYGDERLKEYLTEKDVTQKEFDSILNCTKINKKQYHQILAARQAFLDSIAYRDLFNQTMLLQDSSAIADFNNLARIKVEDIIDDCPNALLRSRVKETFRNNLIENNNKTSVVNNLMKQYPKGRFPANPKGWGSVDKAQHYIDTYYYGDFFKKQGLMADSTFKENFDKVTEKIRPN